MQFKAKDINRMAKIIHILLILIVSSSVLTAQCSFSKTISKLDPTCGANGSINANITNSSIGATFSLYKGNSFLAGVFGSGINVNNLEAGTYKIIIRDSATACTDSFINIVLTASTNAMEVELKPDSVRCTNSLDGKIFADVKNFTTPISFKWSHNSSLNNATASNLPVGNYAVTVTDGSGCIISKNIELKAKVGKMSLKKLTILNAACGRKIGSINIEMEGGYPPYTFKWIDVTNNRMPLDTIVAGKYTCYFLDTLKCDTFWLRDLEVKEPALPKGKITGTDSICFNEGFGTLKAEVIQGDSASITYRWLHNGSTQQQVSGLIAGNYSVVLRDRGGCVDTVRKTIFEYPDRVVKLLGKNTMVSGQVQDIVIEDMFGLYDIVWTPKETSIATNFGVRVFPKDDVTYFMTAKYGPGCVVNARFNINIVEKIDDIQVPDYFSPNQDGSYDNFSLYLNNTNIIEQFEFKIFDRWGNLIFVANTPTFSWDGKNKSGEVVNNSVLNYVMSYTTVDNKFKQINKSGQILLMR